MHVKYSVRTSQRTPCTSITKTNHIMLYREMMVVYWENHTDCINCVNQVQLAILHLVYHKAFRGCEFWEALSHLPFRLRSLRVPGLPIRGQITTSCDGGAYCDEEAVPVGAQDPEVPGS